MKIRKATIEEKEQYKGLYPLYGFVNVDNVSCAIEYCGGAWGKGEPRYEVMAPEGKHFCEVHVTNHCPDNLHSLICFDLKDLRERVTYQELADCEAGSTWTETVDSLRGFLKVTACTVS